MDDILRHGAVRWVGALSLDERDGGLRPTRIPPETGYQLARTTRVVAAECSGVRLLFRTNSPVIELTGVPRILAWPGHDPMATFDLRVDGERVHREHSRAGVSLTLLSADEPVDRVDRGAAVIHVEGLGSAMKDVELWLPHATRFTATALSVAPGSSVESLPPRPTWIHHGSSISHCSAANGPSDIWPAIAARDYGLEVINLGLGGECHIDQCYARWIRDTTASLISLKFGINTRTSLNDRTLPSAVHGFLDTIRDGHPETPIVLCSPIFNPSGETHRGVVEVVDGQFVSATEQSHPSLGLLTVREIRSTLQSLVELRREHGDAHLVYLDGLDLFGPEDEADLSDGAHPTGAGYVRMGARFGAKALGRDGVLAQNGISL